MTTPDPLAASIREVYRATGRTPEDAERAIAHLATMPRTDEPVDEPDTYEAWATADEQDRAADRHVESFARAVEDEAEFMARRYYEGKAR